METDSDTLMAPTPPEICLDRVWRKLKTCEYLLTAPTAASVTACGACLGEIAVDLEAQSGAFQSAPPEVSRRLREKAGAVVEQFRHVGRLLENAAALQQGWANVLASYLRGYTRNGAPAALLYESQTFLRA